MGASKQCFPPAGTSRSQLSSALDVTIVLVEMRQECTLQADPGWFAIYTAGEEVAGLQA